MKGLPPALRKRKRYIAFQVLGNEPVEERGLIQEIWQTALSLYGEYYAAGMNIWVEHFDGRKGVIRCSRDALEKVKMVLTLVSSVGNAKVVIVTMGVAGTIKKCMRYLEVLENASAADGV